MNVLGNTYKILGVIGGAHSCGVAYINGNEKPIVLEEERLNRIKVWRDYEADFCRFPNDSVVCLMERYGVNFDDVDYFTSFLTYAEVKAIFFDTIGYHVPEHKFIKVDHHQAHAAASYYFSGMQGDVLVFCADASGANGYSSKTYIGQNGDMRYVGGISTKRKSLGHFYSALTEFIGFKRLKDEGKIVGLSGHGQFWQALYDVWDSVIEIQGTQTDADTHEVELGGVYLDMHNTFFKMVGSKYWRSKSTLEDIAHTGQYMFENKVTHLLTNIHNQYPYIRKLCLSGGIFANVKLNKRINEMNWVDEVFVLPPMGDEGLALGSALVTLKQLVPNMQPYKINDVFWGNEYTQQEITQAAHDILGEHDYIPIVDYDFIAKLLMGKKILGLYQGRSEHGARALGNRSIIADATHHDTYQRLNDKLQRNDYMPFAPAVIDEDANTIFEVTKSAYTCEFMTMLVNTRDEFKDKIPTCVHPVDKTARIQIVTQQSNNMFYQILKAYKNHMGFGCLVNTSFNVHNEPIVERPQEAFTHLKNGIIDYLVTPYGLYTIAQ
jgi:carbamoyltransferase